MWSQKKNDEKKNSLFSFCGSHCFLCKNSREVEGNRKGKTKPAFPHLLPLCLDYFLLSHHQQINLLHCRQSTCHPANNMIQVDDKSGLQRWKPSPANLQLCISSFFMVLLLFPSINSSLVHRITNFHVALALMWFIVIG